MMIKFKLFNALLLAVLMISTIVGCKKDYIKTPYNDIEEFTVTDSAGNKIKAAISGDSIMVYWAPFQTVPQNITPQITLSSGATISPASGVNVAFNTATMYTVTAQDGTKRLYRLQPMINQPIPIFDVNTSSLTIGGYLGLSGQYFIPDTLQTKLYMIDENNKSIPVSLKYAASFSNTSFKPRLPQDGSMDSPGNYKVKLISGSNIVIKGPYYFGPPDFSSGAFGGDINFSQAGKTIMPGNSLTFSYSRSIMATNLFPGNYILAELRITPNGATAYVTVKVPVSSQTGGLLNFNLPTTIQTGTITRIRLQFQRTEDGSTSYLYTWTPTATTVTSITP